MCPTNDSDERKPIMLPEGFDTDAYFRAVAAETSGAAPLSARDHVRYVCSSWKLHGDDARAVPCATSTGKPDEPCRTHGGLFPYRDYYGEPGGLARIDDSKYQELRVSFEPVVTVTELRNAQTPPQWAMDAIAERYPDCRVETVLVDDDNTTCTVTVHVLRMGLREAVTVALSNTMGFVEPEKEGPTP